MHDRARMQHVCSPFLLARNRCWFARMEQAQIDLNSLDDFGGFLAPAFGGAAVASSGAASSGDGPPQGDAAEPGARHPDPRAAAGPARGLDAEPHIHIGAPIAVVAEPPKKIARHSKEHMANMRAAAQASRAKQREEKLRDELRVASGALASARALLPGAAQL